LTVTDAVDEGFEDVCESLLRQPKPIPLEHVPENLVDFSTPCPNPETVTTTVSEPEAFQQQIDGFYSLFPSPPYSL